MLVGTAGLGKTQMAKVIAEEMATEFHEVLGQAIQSSADLNAVLLAAKDKDVMHIDECHELPKEQQTALYLAIDQRRIILQGGRSGRVRRAFHWPISRCCCPRPTSTACSNRFRDRMKLLLRFDFYTPEELTKCCGTGAGR